MWNVGVVCGCVFVCACALLDDCGCRCVFVGVGMCVGVCGGVCVAWVYM